MSHSLAINKNFTAHQNKKVFTLIRKNSLVCLIIYILKQRVQYLVV